MFPYSLTMGGQTYTYIVWKFIGAISVLIFAKYRNRKRVFYRSWASPNKYSFCTIPKIQKVEEQHSSKLKYINRDCLRTGSWALRLLCQIALLWNSSVVVFWHRSYFTVKHIIYRSILFNKTLVELTPNISGSSTTYIEQKNSRNLHYLYRVKKYSKLHYL